MFSTLSPNLEMHAKHCWLELFLPSLVSFGTELIENRQVDDPIHANRAKFFVHVGRHPDQILHRIIRGIKRRLGVGVQILIGKVHCLGVITI